MVKNRILNLIKREKRLVLSDLENEKEALADTDNLRPAIEDNHWEESLYEAIDQLPKQKRLVCLLKVKRA